MEGDYKKALERARQAIIDCGSNAGRKEMIYGIFPELRESEEELTRATDEKIRKELSAFLCNVANGSVKSMPSASMCQKWLAYLDKQKPAEWSEKDRHAIENCEYAIKETFKDEQNPHRIGTLDWLKSLPERFNPQPGLSKEDFIKFGNREYERGRQDGIQFAERFRWKPSEDGIQQPHWKPREDHFQGLRRGIMKVEKGSDAWNSLTDLYEQLEKL
jgi:hypothetical protein